MSDYRKWIDENFPTSESAYGKCREAVHAMATMFPELRTARGHYYCLVWGERAHWWCVTPDGKVVDPTARQFPSQGGPYDELADDAPEPTGRCPECGELIFGGGDLHPQCEASYTAYLKTGRP